MSSVFTWVTFGLILVAISSKDITAVPIPTALPPLPSRRYLEPPSPQALENAKKFSRGWGPPPPSEFYDGNFFPPNPFKEPPRGMIETNEIQPNNFDGYFPEEEFLVEEEDSNHLEPVYPGDSSYVVEPPQLAYIDSLGNHYQQNRPSYMSSEVDGSFEIENESEKENMSDEVMDDYDNLVNNLGQRNALPQLVLPTNKKIPQKPLQMPLNFDYDSVEVMVDNRRPRGYNKPTFRPENKVKPVKDSKVFSDESVVEKKPVQKELFTRTTTVTKTTTWYADENNDLISKESIDERPSLIKGKYTKKSKTTTSGPIPWYLQNFEEVIFEEENEKRKTILEKIPSLKGLNPTSITSFTTAPNPWSTEVHEEVVFEELKSAKDNIDADLRGQKSHASPLDHIVDYLPRSQTIFEEIEDMEVDLLEELAEMFEDQGEVIVEVIVADFPLDMMVADFPIEIIVPDFPPFAPIPMPQIQFPYPQFQPPMHPVMKPQTAPPQIAQTPSQSSQLSPPPPTSELETTKIEEEAKIFPDNSYPSPNEMLNGMSPNQVTTPKPLTTLPPLIENNFTQYPPVGPIQSPEQMYQPQPNYNLPQPTQMPQLYGNLQTQQPTQNYPGTPPGAGNRRDFNSQLQQQGQNQRLLAESQKEKMMQDDQNRYQQRMDPDGKMKMGPPGPQGKPRQMYPNVQQQGMNRQPPRGRDL